MPAVVRHAGLRSTVERTRATAIRNGNDTARRPSLQLENLLPHIKEVMARPTEIQRRVPSHAFPAEMRRLVAKAAVLFGSTWWYAHHEKRACHLNVSPKYSFEGDEISAPNAYNDVQDATEKAIFDIVVFKMDAQLSKNAAGGVGFVLPPSLDKFKSRIRHLDVAVHVDARRLEGYQSDMLNAVRCIDTLKAHFPNLCACVLTLDIMTAIEPAGLRTFHGTFERFSPAPLQQVQCRETFSRVVTLGTKAAQLFAAFAQEGPGKARFVRFRFFRESDVIKSGRNMNGLSDIDYGFLVSIWRKGREDEKARIMLTGAELLEAAYRYERTGPRTRQHDEECYQERL